MKQGLASRLRHRVTILRRAETRKPNGGYDTAWQAEGRPIAAEVIGISGREAVIGNALQGVEAYRITLRFRTDLTDADQLAWLGRSLNIRNVDISDPRRAQTVVLADTASVERVPT